MGLIKNAVNKVMGLNSGWSGTFSPFGIPGEGNIHEYLKSYRGTVFACASSIAENVGKAEFKAMRGGKETNTYLLELINQPYPEANLTQFSLLELTELYIQLTGEAFWYLVPGVQTGMPVRITLLRPDKMDVAINDMGEVTGYILHLDNGNKQTFEPQEVLHFKKPNPLRPHRGLGPVQAAMVEIQTGNFVGKFVRNFFFNNATPSGIVNFKGTITDKDFQEAKAKWMDSHGGVDNAGKPTFARNAELEYTKIGQSLNELDLSGIKNMSRDDIMFMFKVSKPMLGITDDVNYANGKNARQLFLENVIKPEIERICDVLNTVGERFGFDDLKYNDPVSDIDPEKADYYEKANGVWLTTNEIREREGLSPITGGDSLYMPMNMIPVGSPIPQAKKLTAKKVVKKVEVREVPKLKFITKLTSEEKKTRNEILWKQYDAIITGYEKQFTVQFLKYLERQKKEILAIISPNKSMRTKSYESYLPDLDAETAKFVDFSLPIMTAMTAETADWASGLVGITDFTLSKAFEDYMRERIKRTGQGFTEKTIDALKNSLLEGTANGESLDQIANRVKTIYDFKGEEQYRIDRLVRTETVKLSNKSAIEAYKQSPYVEGIQWQSNPGACEYCEAVNGTSVGLDEKFFLVGQTIAGKDGGEMQIGYADIDTPDLHPNCRCLVVPSYDKVDGVISDEEEGDFLAGAASDNPKE